MTTLVNLYQQTRMNSIQDKSVFQYDGSYRIFHVTTRTKDESDDDIDQLAEQNPQIIGKDEVKRRKFTKKSFRLSTRSGINNWKRKSTRNTKGMTSSQLCPTNSSTNDPNRSINSNDRRSSFPSNNKEKRSTDDDDGTQLTDADLLIGTIDQNLSQDDATLHNLLARADQLETNLKKPDFHKIQPTVVRSSLTRKRKRQLIFIITLIVVLLLFICLVVLIVFISMKISKRPNLILTSTLASS